MDRLRHKKLASERRAKKVRSLIIGTAEKPRLSVHVSNRHVIAQLIDDNAGKTLIYASSIGGKTEGPLSGKAALVGAAIAQKAKKAKIQQVVFDRGPKKYHGRLKELAEAARKEGLEF
jgi:large subunit ribosomal protein L18